LCSDEHVVRGVRGASVAAVALVIGVSSLPTAADAGHDPGVLIGFDAKTGKRLYRKVIDKGPGASLRIVYADGDAVLVEKRRCLSDDDPHSGDISLVGYDATTGDERWSRRDTVVMRPAKVFGYSPLDFAGGGAVPTIRFGTRTVRGIDPSTGNHLWSKSLHGARATRDQYGPALVLASTDETLIVTDAAVVDFEPPTQPVAIRVWNRRTGRTRWTHRLEPGARPWLGAAGGGIVAVATRHPRGAGAGDSDELIQVLDGDDGHLLWSLPARGSTLRGVVDGNVLVDGIAGPLLALAGRDGREVWRAPASGVSDPQLLSGRGIVFAGRPLGRTDDVFALLALNARDGRTRWSAHVGPLMAVTADARIVLTTTSRATPRGTLPAELTARSRASGRVLWKRPAMIASGVGARDVVVFARGCPTTLDS
jgi:outer membrane protein assembly factor BamB